MIWLWGTSAAVVLGAVLWSWRGSARNRSAQPLPTSRSGADTVAPNLRHGDLRPARVRLSVPEFLRPLHPEEHPYTYWDGSREAAAAAFALSEIPAGMRRLFQEAVEAASLTVRLADDEDIRLLAPDCVDDNTHSGRPIGLYLPGQCILVAVNCSDRPDGLSLARETAIHEALHAIDDHLGTPAGLPGDYVSEEELFQALVDGLPGAVQESFRTWGYSEDVINREIFAEGGAAYLAHRDAPAWERARQIGLAVTRYATDVDDPAVMQAGHTLDAHFAELEQVLDTSSLDAGCLNPGLSAYGSTGEGDIAPAVRP